MTQQTRGLIVIGLGVLVVLGWLVHPGAGILLSLLAVGAVSAITARPR